MRREVFQAIADPTRRAIIALLALQAMTPNAIAEHFDSTRQAVSKHLRILTECELVTQEQKGREIYYSLEIEKMKEIDKWLEQYRKIWETRFDQLDDVLARIKNRKTKNKHANGFYCRQTDEDGLHNQRICVRAFIGLGRIYQTGTS